MQLTCEEDCKEEDEQQVLTSLAHFEPATALLCASSPRCPAAYHTYTHYYSDSQEIVGLVFQSSFLYTFV